MRKLIVFGILVVLVLIPFATTSASPRQQGDPFEQRLHEINAELLANGIQMQIAQVEFFSFGQGRSSTRILQQQFRWMPNDPRRNPQGNDITYMVDPNNGATASGLSAADTEAAIDRAFATWNAERCTRANFVKRGYTGGDVTIYDAFFGFGGFGDYLAADIVNAGWYPPEFFAAAGASPTGTLAFSVTFTWVNDDGTPADLNGDNYVDTALNEVYYNDAFGGALRPGNPWGIDAALPSIDVETVGLHENGHSIGLGHFGPPPSAVMNPVYAGIVHEPRPTDHAGTCTIYAQWPNR